MAEPFDVSIWKARIAAWWREAVPDLPGTMARLGVQTTYGMLAASALLPVVVAHASNPDPATAALAIVLSNVGTNLLANLAQKDYDEASAARKAEQEINECPHLRLEYQQMLAALDVVTAAQQALGEQWSGFESQLRQELARMNGGVRVNASGSASVFWNVSTSGGDLVGHDQWQSGERSALGSFEHSLVWTGDLNLVLQKPSTLELEQLLATIMHAVLKGQANVQAHQDYRRTTVTAAGSPTVILSEQTADGLAQAAAGQRDELAYLTALRVHPRYGSWSTQFVPLAGWLSLPPDAHPEFRLLEGAREGGQIQIKRTPVRDVTEALQQHPAVVLTGKPGAGKTTQLYKLALDAARQWCETRAGKIPLFVPLADYRGYPSPQAMVQTVWHNRVGTDNLEERLRQGQLLLLGDSLNEMPAQDEEDYRERTRAWRRFVDDWPGNWVVFTCRKLDYSALLGLPEVQIQDLDNTQTQEFLHKYVPDIATWMWDRLQNDPLLELVRTPYHLAMLAHVISCDQQWPANRAALFDRFVACLLDREKRRGHRRWIDERAQRKALRELAESMQPMGKETTRLPVGKALARLPTEVDVSGVACQTPPQDVLDLALAATLLDKEGLGSENEEVRFYHHQLQEFFAAEALWERWKHGEDLRQRWFQPRSVAEMPDPGPLGPFEPLPAPPATRWEEPTILAAGLADDPAKFVTAVQGVNPVLAARCLVEAGIARDTAVVESAQEALLKEISNPQVHVRTRIAAGEALGRLGDPRLREITVSGHRVLLPSLVHVSAASFQIGSTRWQVALVRLRGFTLHDEVPRHTVRLPEFHVGMFPVTNAEFACFVDTGGYRDERHWRTESARAWLHGKTAESEMVKELMQLWRDLKQDPSGLRRLAPTERDAAAWKQVLQMEETEMQTLSSKTYAERPRDRPAHADDERFNNPSQPVVGVTWFEACAYCNWLDEQIRAADTPLEALGTPLLDEDHVVRLPTEAEWEAAARAPHAWVYPWGDRWDPNRANTYEGHVLRTTPVGMYSQGTTPAGAHDLSGNVLEWTQSLYRPYPTRSKDGRNEPSASGARMLRGGSWYHSKDLARSAFRYRKIPDFWCGFVGFRVVFSLANPEF